MKIRKVAFEGKSVASGCHPLATAGNRFSEKTFQLATVATFFALGCHPNALKFRKVASGCHGCHPKRPTRAKKFIPAAPPPPLSRITKAHGSGRAIIRRAAEAPVKAVAAAQTFKPASAGDLSETEAVTSVGRIDLAGLLPLLKLCRPPLGARMYHWNVPAFTGASAARLMIALPPLGAKLRPLESSPP